ncbi:MAG: hypothetical protein H6639_16065 [Caldilineaceae bacterium]|nr:hypothetical protein [Caldilineaceae bacterium]
MPVLARRRWRDVAGNLLQLLKAGDCRSGYAHDAALCAGRQAEGWQRSFDERRTAQSEQRQTYIVSPSYEVFVLAIVLVTLATVLSSYSSWIRMWWAVARIMNAALSVFLILDVVRRLVRTHRRHAVRWFFLEGGGWSPFG